MPSQFMPNGMVANHSSPGSLSVQYCGDPMNASILPWEAASKHSNGCMIWPPGKTSIRNRPPLISSTTFASRWAVPWRMSNTAVKVVDIRHWTFGCAMMSGALATAATPASAPLAFARNLRRSIIRSLFSCSDELVVGAFGDVVPGPHQGLELREGRVDLPGHGRLLGFFLDDLGGQLLEITQDRSREGKELDL